MKSEPVIIIDTREQNPLLFGNLPTKVGTLDAGDYSIDGLTHLIAVERKGLDDLLACCGRERDRFKRELQRLRAYRFRLLVIEADAATLESGVRGGTPWRSTLKPTHVLGSLAAWTAQYGLPVWLAGTHEAAGRFVERYLYQCARAVLSENSSAVGLTESFVGEPCGV